MRPYPAYRDSGIEWLGEVPEHWGVARLKWSRSATLNGVWGDEPDGENDIPCIRIADFDRQRFRVRFEEPTVRSVSSAKRNGRVLRPGDLLLEKSGGGEHQLVGCVVLYEHNQDAVCSNFIARVSLAEGSDARYWTYAHATLYASRLNHPAVKQSTGIQNLDSDAYFDTPFVFPPGEEQEQIAAFLDRETERIDSLIAKKGLLIERLQEYRTALITRTVTRGLPPKAARAAGLDPSPRLKPSGVEWLGDVPEDWDVMQLGRAGTFSKGGGGTKEDEVEDGVPCVRYGDLYTQHRFSFTKTRAHIAEGSTARYTPIRYGDLLFAGSGETIEEIGKSAVNLNTEPVYGGGDIIVFRPAIEIDASFLGYAADCSHAVYQKSCMGRGVTVMHIYTSELKRLLLPLPPLDEQGLIADFLDQDSWRIDELVSRTGIVVERLQEYRSALITAAVTGKIDVRGEASVTADRAG